MVKKVFALFHCRHILCDPDSSLKENAYFIHNCVDDKKEGFGMHRSIKTTLGVFV